MRNLLCRLLMKLLARLQGGRKLSVPKRDSFGFPLDENVWGQRRKELLHTATRANGKRLLTTEQAKAVIAGHVHPTPPPRLNFSPEQTAQVEQIALVGRMARSSVYRLIRERMNQHKESPAKALQMIADKFRAS